MQPGLSRAVPMGILGFLFGVFFVTGLRALQSIEPVWAPELALVLAAFTTTAAFVWGMGAANPDVNAHPHEPEEDEYGLIVADEDTHHDDAHHEDATEPDTTTIFGYSLWTITTWTIVLVVGLFALASLSFGPSLRVSNDPNAEPTNFTATTEITLPVLGTMEVTQLALFVMLAGFTILSLAVAGGVIGLAFYALSRGIKTAEASEPQEAFALLAAPAEQRKERALQQGEGVVSNWLVFGAGVLMLALMLVAEIIIFDETTAQTIRLLGLAFFTIAGGYGIAGAVIEDDGAARYGVTVVGAFGLAVVAILTGGGATWLHSVGALILGLAAGYGLSLPLFESRYAQPSLGRVTLFLGVAIFTYWAFWYVLVYYALLGLDRIFGMTTTSFFLGDINVFGVFIFKNSDWFLFLNTLLSAVNAIGIALTLFYPGVVTRAVGRGARGLARWLRGAPEFLGQK